MPAPRRLTALQERKRLLAAEADVYRESIRAECVNACERISAARDKARSVGPWLGLGMAAAGLFVGWRGRKLTRWIPAALAAWRSIRRLKGR